MKFYEKYNFEPMLIDLQKKLRIADWDIVLEVVNGVRMKGLGQECTTFGLCEKWRKLREAYVYLNGDTLEEDDFFQTLLHELIHVSTDDFCRAAGDVIELIKDNKDYYDMQQDHITVEYERMVNDLAKSFEACLGKEYLEQFLVEEVDNEQQTEESVGRKRGKDKVH